MHEAHVMRDLMREIARVAAEQGARRVVALRVWLGALSHMTPEHFREHFLDAIGRRDAPRRAARAARDH